MKKSRLSSGEPIVRTGRNTVDVESEKCGYVDIFVSKSTYTRLSKKAKRANLGVAELLEKLAGEK